MLPSEQCVTNKELIVTGRPGPGERPASLSSPWGAPLLQVLEGVLQGLAPGLRQQSTQ